MIDLEAQTDQASSMSDSHHSFFESSSVGGMSRLDENTHENTIPNRSDVAILEDGEMDMSQGGLKWFLMKKKSMLNRPTKVSFNLCIKISITSRQVELLYFAHKLPNSKIINGMSDSTHPLFFT